MTTTSRTEVVDPEMPSTALVIRAEPRRVTECPECHRTVGPMLATEIACPRRNRG
jgi:hypothetical protein